MWTSLIGLFAGPIGTMINKGIGVGAAALVATSVAHGNPIGDISNIVGMFAVAISTVISGFAATQGIQIPIINADQTNGVTVVPASAARNANINAASAPLK